MKFLIAGLGNMDHEYFGTRHNIGFDVVDAFAQKHKLTWEIGNFVHQCNLKLKGKQIKIIKPTTFMNLSGKALKFWINKEGIPLENVLVILDDLNLEFGQIRLKPNGSDGGHNGLKDINVQLNTNQYARYRIGIGSNFRKGHQVNFVLGKWTPEELKDLSQILTWSVDLIESFCLAGIGNTMNSFNSKRITN